MATQGPTISFEIEVGLSGTYVPGEAETGPTYDCGGTPAVGESVEDLEIVALGALESVRAPTWERGSHRLIWKSINLLEGVNTASPDIQRLFANILALKRDEAEQAVLTEVCEDRWAGVSQ